MSEQKLNAKNLKNVLWETLNRIGSKELTPSEGDAVACQAREILRTVNVQLRISEKSTRPIVSDLISFNEE